MSSPRQNIRAVLDTSVLVPEWSRRVLQRAAAPPYSLYRPIWSEWIIAETWYILTLRAVQAGIHPRVIGPDNKAMLRRLLAVMEAVSVATIPPGMPPSPLRDRDDEAIWLAAVLAGAQYVISHNTRDFPSLARSVEAIDGRQHAIHRHIHQGIEFLTAIEFVEDVLRVDAEQILGAALPEGGSLRSRRSVITLD